ncbi:protein ELC-like [Canna indica]|uniref:Protein ELC-like n=1 Tax=Canna indica TaxID=4628 RepID=A0AAQ3JMB0_9LILI|nr:protein ELC-like [Canna indica]
MVSSSSSTRFINAALQTTGEKALSYIHGQLKWLIGDHLVSLLDEFPTLSAHCETFTDEDGADSLLLQAHGSLPISSSMPHVIVTIWLLQAYPFTPPRVFIFPTAKQAILPDHPFVEPSGLVSSPYLEEWLYPKSNLRDLARNLVKIFKFCHPYSSGAASASFGETSFASKREAIDRLFARLHSDTKQLQAQTEADIERLGNTQAVLRDRARVIKWGLRELEGEERALKKAVEEKVDEADMLSTWLRLHGTNSLLASSLSDEVEGFEPVDERGRCLLEEEAAVLAIDEVVYALDGALETGVLDFRTYIKQVRGLAREQFFPEALLNKSLEISRKMTIGSIISGY